MPVYELRVAKLRGVYILDLHTCTHVSIQVQL